MPQEFDTKNFKILASMAFYVPFDGTSFKDERLSELASTFDGNITRIGAMIFASLAACGVTFVTPELIEQVHQVTQELGPLNLETETKDTLKRRMDTLLSWARATDVRNYSNEELNDLIRLGERQMSIVSRVPMIARGIESVMSAQIVYAWGAFEALAEDLWAHAVNVRPKSLAKNVIAGGRSSEDVHRSPLSVPLKSLEEFDFNISGRVAEFLIEGEYVRFNSLANTESAYLSTFRNAEDKRRRPSTVLRDIFGKHRQEMGTLELVRNLYAHQSGKVDRRFRERTRNTEFSSLNIGEAFPIDGDVVSRFLNRTIETASDLLSFVDKWLLDHKD